MQAIISTLTFDLAPLEQVIEEDVALPPLDAQTPGGEDVYWDRRRCAYALQLRLVEPDQG
jgi:hypothetical protein